MIEDSIAGAVGYTAWASRYLHEYRARKEDFGYIAINSRSNAARNPAAAGVGGSLSEGETQGSGHVREAVHRLQGLVRDRQVSSAETALITAGGFFFNAHGLTLRRG